MNSILTLKPFNSEKIFRNLCMVVAFIVLSAPWKMAVAEVNPDAPGLTQAPGLFISQNAPEAQTNGVQRRNKAALRHRSVQVDTDVLKNKLILLNLFDDIEFAAERTHMKMGLEGEVTWSGELLGPIHGIAHITVFDDAAAGSISTEDG